MDQTPLILKTDGPSLYAGIPKYAYIAATIDWKKATIDKLIELYRNAECLWNPLNCHSKNNAEKQRAYQGITVQLGFPLDDRYVDGVAKKIKHLRIQFVKQNRIQRSAARNKDSPPAKPSWCFYEQLTFLRSVVGSHSRSSATSAKNFLNLSGASSRSDSFAFAGGEEDEEGAIMQDEGEYYMSSDLSYDQSGYGLAPSPGCQLPLMTSASVGGQAAAAALIASYQIDPPVPSSSSSFALSEPQTSQASAYSAIKVEPAESTESSSASMNSTIVPPPLNREFHQQQQRNTPQHNGSTTSRSSYNDGFVLEGNGSNPFEADDLANDYYGRYVSSTLNQMPLVEREQARLEIQQILCRYLTALR